MKEDTTGRAMDRRAFLQYGAAGVAAAGWAAMARAEETPRSRVVLLRHANAADAEGVGAAPVVREMVHRAVRELSGKDDLAEAWRSFVSPDDIVGLKVNVRAGNSLSTQMCTVDAIVEGLKAAGVADTNIVVWDAWNREFPAAGYTLNETGEGVQCYGSDHGAMTQRKRGDQLFARAILKPYYADAPVKVAGKDVWLTKIVTEKITALINVPILKEHNITGVTIALKNHFGSILNPSDLHDSACDPSIAELNAVPAIKDKTRLVLVDALRGCYAEGPYDRQRKGRFIANTIYATRDPVAADTVGMRIIDDQRRAKDLPPVGDRARHVATAAKLGVGTNDFGRIDLDEIDLTGTA
ncbi:MAG: hypothetical protein QG656_2486 [Candidatus Hydrogenedentes bacterium]|nr:hypothetical protein [Candidatus Hydrogenedentota bacterium]